MDDVAILLSRAEKFISPEPNSGCWLWIGGWRRGGYGEMWDGDRLWGAHRLVYTLMRGPIPAGLQLDHLCRTKPCVNPWHLEPVTSRENTLRGTSPLAIKARARWCLSGRHEFTTENTTLKADSRTGRIRRQCWACNLERMRTWHKNRQRDVRALVS